MLSWASQHLEKLAQTVAPPPTDAIGRFVYAVQRDDESSAQGCLAEIMDPINTIVQPNKGTVALHLACQHGMERLIRQLLSIPNANVQVLDGMGNTPLHYACMNSSTNTALNTVRLLVTQFQASVIVKNGSGQAPYDVATVNSVRQYLLPLQLQQETQHALDNGGVGLPPGIDMGGLRIKNSAVPPPPMGGALPSQPPPAGAAAYAQPPPAGFPPPATTNTPTNQPAGMPDFSTPSPNAPQQPEAATAIPPAVDPASGSNTGYARTGHSSLAVGQSKYRPDGFHSSSSDVSLQRKYGHVSTGASGVAPPPISGNSIGQAPSSLGTNPYARGSTKSRYLAHDGSAVAPASGGYGGWMPQPPATAPAASYTTFMPGQAPAVPAQTETYQQQQYSQQPHDPYYAQSNQQQQANQMYQPAQPSQSPYSGQHAQPSHSYESQPSAVTPAQVAQPMAAPVVAPPAQGGLFPPPPLSSATQTNSYQPPATQPANNLPEINQQTATPVKPAQDSQEMAPQQEAASIFATPNKETADDVFAATPAFPSPQPMQQFTSNSSNSAQELFAAPSPAAGVETSNDVGKPAMPSAQPIQQFTSNSNNSAQELFSAPPTAGEGEITNDSSRVPAMHDSANYKANDPVVETKGEPETDELEDDLQDVPLSQEDRPETVTFPPTQPPQDKSEPTANTASAQQLFSSVGGLPPPPFFSKN